MSVQATCYLFESSTDTTDDVTKYKTIFKLDRGVVESKSSIEWKDEATLEMRLRKEDAPSYWPRIVLHAVDETIEDLRVGLWN